MPSEMRWCIAMLRPRQVPEASQSRRAVVRSSSHHVAQCGRGRSAMQRAELTSRRRANQTDNFACKRSAPLLSSPRHPSEARRRGPREVKAPHRPVRALSTAATGQRTTWRRLSVLSSCAAAVKRTVRTTHAEHDARKERREGARKAPATCGWVVSSSGSVWCKLAKSSSRPRHLPLTAPQSCLQCPPLCVM